MYCTSCGKQNSDTARFCTECGTSVSGSSSAQPETKNPRAGTRDRDPAVGLINPRNPPLSPNICWLNILIAGLAQMVHGQIGKGLLITFVVPLILFNLPLALGLACLTLSIIDAYKLGVVLQRGQAVGKWQFFSIETR